MDQATSHSSPLRRAGFLRVGRMDCCARLILLATLVGLSGGVSAADFSCSHFEVTADPRKTGDTATAPLEDEANSRFFGNAGFREVSGPFHVSGSWSRECKGFGTVDEPGRNVKARSGLSRVILHTGRAALCRMLDDKAANVITVNPACTSLTCHECRTADSRHRKSRAEFHCMACGHADSADLNAAANILAFMIDAFARRRALASATPGTR